MFIHVHVFLYYARCDNISEKFCFQVLLIIESTIAKSNYSWKNEITFLKEVGGIKKVIAKQKIFRPIKM